MPEAAGTPAFDVLIAGGGPIGSAIAQALSGSHLRVALVGPGAPAHPDPRPIALSHGSKLILEQLGCWPPGGATAITAIHVSHQGRFGRTLINAAEHQLPALGHVIAYDELQRAASVGLGCTQLTGLVQTIEDRATLARAVTSNGVIDARLVVLADGGHLTESRSQDYGQVALVAHIETDTPHQGRAWERFTPEGPLALLPFDSGNKSGNGYGMVWCTSPQRAAGLAEMNQGVFLAALQHAFGNRAGRFISASARSQFPLALRRARHAPLRCVTVGNAAQALHPVAGQGLNLGLRDGVELARMIRDCAAEALGEPAFVARYRAVRAPDRNAGVRVTDALVKLFSNSNAAAGLARGAGLFLLDMLPAPRRFLTRRMMFGMRALP